MNHTATGKLFVVATPIGNLEDITLRALRILKEADWVAAEDTRHTGMLLSHFGIKKPILSYHKFNEAKRGQELLIHFEQGRKIALVSDAGTPGISDPGERLIRTCIEQGVPVEIIPGPSAVLHALVGSGFPLNSFYFGGFLPIKSGGRQRELLAAKERGSTSIYFESPHRILKTLTEAKASIPENMCVVARELTKKFEEIRRGKPAELLEYFEKNKPRGEICFIVSSE